MMGTTLMMLLLSGVPYAIIAAMPGKKTYAVTSIIYILFVVYGSYDIRNADGPGGFLAILFFHMISTGAIVGIIVKAITLFMKSRGASLTKRLYVFLAGILIIPSCLYAPTLFHKWKHRAPSNSCNYDMVTFSIDEQKLYLPSLSIISVNNGTGKPPYNSIKNHFGFHGPRGFRKFCNNFDNGNFPAHVNAIVINFDKMGRALNQPRFKPLCKKAGWPEAICLNKEFGSPNGYPEEIALYDKNKFFAGYFSGGWDFERIKNHIEVENLSTDENGFFFDGHYHFWIENEPSQNAQKPFSMKCRKHDASYRCNVDEKLSNNLYLHYEILVSTDESVKEAKELRKTVLYFVKSAQKPF